MISFEVIVDLNCKFLSFYMLKLNAEMLKNTSWAAVCRPCPIVTAIKNWLIFSMTVS